MAGYEMPRCRQCGLRYADQSFDFGNGLILVPECNGIRVKVLTLAGEYRELSGVLTRSELQHFLDTAYGTQERRLELE